MQTSGLCSGCEHKLESGELREVEVGLSHLLAKYREKLALERVEFTRAYDLGNIIFVFTSSNPGFLIGRGGKVISTLIKGQGKHIRVVRENSDLHALAEEILRPVKLLHVNSVFHDGSEVTKIVVSQKLSVKLPAKPVELEKLFANLSGKQVKIAFE